uniref:Degreening-related gene dee76 protein n=1 Tax=Auxenochlorella protothecoides TaxID=3075 RepID=DEE76_AUXPR|nr:RecName: Full=Degreening-related gene dee76 protein [Auxenochlorella protothecoides]CAB42595.1 putative MO25 protein [Auxenochlorella protothecoides]
MWRSWLREAHQSFERLPYESKQDRVVEDISKAIMSIKEAIFGEDEQSSSKEHAQGIASEACRVGLVSDLVTYLTVLDFETRKDVVQIFCAIIRITLEDGGRPGRDYVLAHPDVLSTLFYGYEDPEIALNCGQMFRECIRHEDIAKFVLECNLFEELFEKLNVQSFEVASDAFATFKDLLTRHKQLVAAFLQENYEDFFSQLDKLLTSDNYVTRRQSLKLLGELLLDRVNVKIMMQYVSDVNNLILMMNLLKDSSRSIQFEAFHVFKVFVANPNKTKPVADILVNNKNKLLTYLEDFHNDRDDEQFKEEKAVIIKEISMMHA